MTDRFFHQIAKLIDWDDLSYKFVSRLLTENGYQVPAETKSVQSGQESRR